MPKDLLHVVMIPWSAFGHMWPFFQLSIALAKAGVKISFVQTPKNIKRLPKIPPNLTTLINLVELPLPALDNDVLPEGAEATVDLPFEKYQYLKTAYDLLKEPFKKFVADQLPDWIFVDVIPYWAAEVAMEYQVPLVYFTVFTACTDVFLGSPDYLIGEGQKKLRPSPESLKSAPQNGSPSHLLFSSRNMRLLSVLVPFMDQMALKNLMPIAFARPYSHAKLWLYAVAMSLKVIT